MGKRGPKATIEFKDKTAVMSTRIRQDTREMLQAAADRHGHSLSQEIERRLRAPATEDLEYATISISFEEGPTRQTVLSFRRGSTHNQKMTEVLRRLLKDQQP
jgi:uncharacterized protein (DUF1778 family)